MRNGGLGIRHMELEVETWRYLRGDGVHLNEVGIDMWVLGSGGLRWSWAPRLLFVWPPPKHALPENKFSAMCKRVDLYYTPQVQLSGLQPKHIQT